MTDFTKLAGELDGPLFLPGDPGYAAESFTFHLTHPLTPMAVAGAASTADVQAAVRFAAANNLPVAVRGGGHLQTHRASDALLITLDRMSGVTVDADRRTARVTGAARWQAVIDASAAAGLAPLSGSSVTVGAIGYVLGGGQGPILGRLHGYASDHVRSFDIVTADGESRTVDAGHEPDLFAALRGGKGNFGVVTAMEIDLFPVATVYGGGLYFSGHDIREVLHAWRDWEATLPDEATTSFAVQWLPPFEQLPPPLRGANVVHVRFAYVGSAEAGAALVAPMRAVAPAIIDTVAEVPFPVAAVLHNDPTEPAPAIHRCVGLGSLPDAALDKLIELTGPESPLRLVSVEVRALGGALDVAPAGPDSVPSRGLPFHLIGLQIAPPPDVAAQSANLEFLIGSMRPWADVRRMVNFVGPEEALNAAELRELYGPELYDRLLTVKAKYDPTSMFRKNHTIRAL
ncbi:FAD-binding oxidoreductase [Actinoplanes sp. HUAS TT8]|uniref:FAD-binding oxidoreductase n=1 Tax=Actinoplanes sp. HUAS TT8 TaxID=3447453 RepID=UPI003F522D8A